MHWGSFAAGALAMLVLIIVFVAWSDRATASLQDHLRAESLRQKGRAAPKPEDTP